MLFIKSSALAVLALAASVSAQMNHTYFTNPVGEGQVYTAGDNTTFSWQLKCVSPNIYISSNPSKVSVELVNSTNSNNAYFLAEITTIDCTQNQGNTNWVIPAKYGDGTSLFSLKMVFDRGNTAYSGRFTIPLLPANPAVLALSPLSSLALLQ
ncbi:hypothetical protein BGZ65_008618 [Modicella reniformis]|uniref:Yeast cell wall synthesis Kre9/Knh1-like N-terminal domain-containing protein n=1 Tax=Modicella reniformis TaxID=1440133 RepID=A0A9P6LTL2_9FUNG|nr:hypothetical protein BGZ65_008618 [Modicella reniformis]